jgi:hypothetical protein
VAKGVLPEILEELLAARKRWGSFYIKAKGDESQAGD